MVNDNYEDLDETNDTLNPEGHRIIVQLPHRTRELNNQDSLSQVLKDLKPQVHEYHDDWENIMDINEREQVYESELNKRKAGMGYNGNENNDKLKKRLFCG